MDIDGTYTLQAAPEVVWNLLMDQDMLQQNIPGMERLEQTGEDTYTFTLHIKHAPLTRTIIPEMQLSRSWSILTCII